MNHFKILVITTSIVGFGAVENAHADASHAGSVTAETAGGTLITTSRCARKSRTWDYVRCGKIVRERVKSKLCRKLGKGSHSYYRTIGTGKRSRTSVYCGRSSSSPPQQASSDVDSSVIGLARTGTPGRNGTISVFAPSRARLLTSKRCGMKGRVIDYYGCAKVIRTRVKSHLCSTLGKGRHTYYRQMGSAAKSKETAYCASGSSAGRPTNTTHTPSTSSPSTGSHRVGAVSAFFPTRSTLLETRRCSKRRFGWNYATCGNLLRSAVKRQLCKRLGKGSHSYYYKAGTGTKRKVAIFCR